MASYLVVGADGLIRNAGQSRTGIPQKIDESDAVIPIDDSIFDITMVIHRKHYNFSTGEVEPEYIRKLVLMTPGPYTTGTVNLQFEQQNLEGQAFIEPATFEVSIDGDSQSLLVADGSLEIVLTAPEPATVIITITASRYEPVLLEVVIGG